MNSSIKKGHIDSSKKIFDKTIEYKINHVLPEKHVNKILKSLCVNELNKETFIAISDEDNDGFFEALIRSQYHYWHANLKYPQKSLHR